MERCSGRERLGAGSAPLAYSTMPAPDDVRVLWMKAKTLLALEVTEEDWEGLLNEQYADKPKVRAPPGS